MDTFMKYVNILLSILFFMLLVTITPQVCATTPQSPTPSAKFVDDEILVKLKPYAPSSDINPLAQAISGKIAKELLLKNTFVLNVPKGSVEKVIKTLLGMPQIASATPNYITQKQSLPNDPSLEKAWELLTKKGEIKIAILDTGIAKTQLDLENKILLETNFTSSTESGDLNGHGTQIAKIIDDLPSQAILMNIKVLNDQGFGTYSDIADGIVWSVDNGAKVINLSLGGLADLQLLHDAIDYAYDKGTIIIASAGTNNLLYPAHYNNVLSYSTPEPTPITINTPAPSAIPAVEPELPPAPPIHSEPTKTPTPQIKQNTITASNIEMWTSDTSLIKDIFIKVTISEQSDNSVVANALITMDLTTPEGTVFTGTTISNSQGQAVFALRNVKASGTYKSQITKVTVSSPTYIPTKTKSQLEVN